MPLVIMTIQEYNKLLKEGKAYFEEVKRYTELIKKHTESIDKYALKEKEAESNGD